MEKWQFRNRLSALTDNPTGDVNMLPANMPVPGQEGLSGLAQTKLNGLSQQYDTPMMDRYQQHLQSQPNPANYQPSKMDRLWSGLGSLGTSPQEAMQWQENTLRGKYNRENERYFQQAKLLGEGANVEEKNIANKRGIAYNEARMQLAEEANRIKSEHEAFLRDKSQQINDVAWAKITKDYDALQQRYDLTIQQMQQKGATADSVAQIQRERMEMMRDYYNGLLEAGKRRHEDTQSALEETTRRNDAYIKRLGELGEPVETTTTLEDKPGGGQMQTTIRRRANQTPAQLKDNPDHAGEVQIKDKATGMIIGTISVDDAKNLDTTKYEVVGALKRK